LGLKFYLLAAGRRKLEEKHNGKWGKDAFLFQIRSGSTPQMLSCNGPWTKPGRTGYPEEPCCSKDGNCKADFKQDS
jgi:hypothetical protein